MHWQTMMPQVRGATPKGWGGRLADIFTQTKLKRSSWYEHIHTGNNTLQTGFNTIPYVTSSDGAVLLDNYMKIISIQTAVDSILANISKHVRKDICIKTKKMQ